MARAGWSEFYGKVLGRGRNAATQCGTKASGLDVIAASKQGAVRVELTHDEETGADLFSVVLIPWDGVGTSRHIADGRVDGGSIETTDEPQPEDGPRPAAPGARRDCRVCGNETTEAICLICYKREQEDGNE